MSDDPLNPTAAASEPEGTTPRSAESLHQALDEARDRALRAQAELENFRKRARRELEDERRYANFDLLRDLLPVLDNIGRAIAAAEKSQDAAAVLEGMKMVARHLEDVLSRAHCQRIEALGQPFDPNLHSAILQQPDPQVPAGHVMMVAQEGYLLHDRVIRPAQVIVSTGPAE